MCVCVCICVEQSENINLDPDLHAACKDDVSKLCSKVHPGNAAVSWAQFCHGRTTTTRFAKSLTVLKSVFIYSVKELCRL